jgi:hypothetical protein
MAEGQLAVNTAAASTGLFFKDSTGALVKTGPVHIGTTAPNADPAEGGQAGNSVGEAWLDTTGTNALLKIWDGSVWKVVQPVAAGDVVSTSDTGTVTSTMIADGTIVDADVNASAAIAGTKISPDFGSQNVVTTGTSTAASLIPTGSSVPTNGVYLPAANSVGISTNGTGRLFVDSAGKVSLTGDIEFSRTSPAGISVDSGGRITISADTANTASTTAINFNIDGTEACDIFAGGQLRFNKTNFANAGVCTQELDSLLGLGGGANTQNSGINIQLSGPDRVSEIGYQMRWNANRLYRWDKTSDFHTWHTGTSNERMRLDSSGRLGLGTNSPSTLLHVQSSVASSDLVYLYNTSVAASDVLRLNTEGTGTGTLIFDAQSAGSSRLVVRGDGNVGIGTTSPNESLEVAGNIHVSGADRSIFNRSNNALAFGTNNTERARIDSSGRLLVGTATALTNIFIGGTSTVPRVQLLASDLGGSSLSLVRTGTTGATIFLNAGSSDTNVIAGSILGRHVYNGFDGTNYRTGAQITVEVDGTPGANDMPGRLVFSTTPSGSSSPTERLRLNSAGNLLIGNTTGTDTLSVTGTASVSTSITTTNAYNDGTVSKDTKTDGMVIGGGIDLPGTTTNLHLRSQDFSTGWVSSTAAAMISVDSGVIAPDGTTGVGKFVCADTTAISRRLYPSTGIITSSGTEYTYSVYLKSVNNWPFVGISFTTGTGVSGGTFARFDLINGIAFSAANNICSIANAGNNWWRISITTVGNTDTSKRPKVILINSSSDTGTTTVTGIVDAGVYVWGAQLTPVPSGQTTALGPYIRTEGTAVTDAAGYIKINGTNRITSPAANTLGFNTDDTERARITDTGALLVGTTATPTGAGSGAVVAQDRVVISSIESGRSQIIADSSGTVTATTGTIVFKFKASFASARSAYVKLYISQGVNNNTATNSPAAEYAFQLHTTNTGVCSLNNATTVFEYTYDRATHFAFANLGSRECTVTLTNPTAQTLTGAYKVEILTSDGTWTLDSVTTT